MSVTLPPPAWTNPQISLYHGTIEAAVPSILAGIDVRQGRPHTDFGQGFYTTTWLQQAQLRAWQLSVRRGSAAVVIQFDVDRDALAMLDTLWFIRGGFVVVDFWSLVHHCRSGRGNHARTVNNGWYDVVVGPLVASWKQRLIVADADQMSFHTARAASVLNASRSHILVVP